ncbi:MAG TPA: DMT family transporter [Fluviicola sp.]|nr:DMT family transporter [Fluviicola sp.]
MNAAPEKTSKNLTIAMIVSMVLWGVSWPSSGVLSAFGSPIELGIFRYLFVVLSLLLLLVVLKIPIKISRKGIPFVLISAALMAMYNYTFLKGLQDGNAGAGGILVTTMNPIMAYILGMFIDWKRPNVNETIGISLGIIAGLTMLEIWSNVNILADPWNGLFLLSAFLWSVMSKFTSKAGKYGSSFAFSWWMYVVTLLFMLPLMDVSEMVRLVHIKEFTFWGNLLFGSVIVTTLATTMYFFATAKIGAEKASSFIFTVPFTAALSAWLILDEKIEVHTIIGGVIGIGAVYMINRKVRV